MMKKQRLMALVLSIAALGMLTACAHSKDTTPAPAIQSAADAPASGALAYGQFAEGTTGLCILADVGGITLQQGDNYALEGENLIDEWFSTEMQDGCLTILYQPPSPEAVQGIDTSAHHITVTLPASHSITRVELNAGTGTMAVSNLNCDSVLLSQGTGSMRIEELEADELTIECGAGTVSGQGMIVTEKAVLQAGTGDIELNGDFSGYLGLEGGTGTTVLRLTQPRESYDIRGESVVKNILIDGKPLENSGDSWENWTPGEEIEWEGWNFGKEPASRHTAASAGEDKHIIEIDGGVGSVEIYFSVR